MSIEPGFAYAQPRLQAPDDLRGVGAGHAPQRLEDRRARRGREVVAVEELDEDALIQILLEPKNALTKQYRKLFEMEGVELEFRDDALTAVARRAMERKTGARGLRTILENVLLDTMYDLPSSTSAKKVVVDEAVVTGETKPYVIYESDESPTANIEQQSPRPTGSDGA